MKNMSICKMSKSSINGVRQGDKMSDIVKFNNEKYADDYHNVSICLSNDHHNVREWLP